MVGPGEISRMLVPWFAVWIYPKRDIYMYYI